MFGFMKRSKGTYFKALVLVMVFSLNTMVSFACSFSGGFHGLHHHRELPAKKESHHHPSQHHHDHGAAQPLHHDQDASKNQEEDCCSKNFVEIEKKDKSVARLIEVPGASFLTSFIISYSPLFAAGIAEERPPHCRTFVRCWVPATIQDLRIVIQSFQI